MANAGRLLRFDELDPTAADPLHGRAIVPAAVA
jgi:hypothetical protein